MRKLLNSTIRLPGPRLIGLRTRAGLEGIAMETFTQLFGDLLAFVYHCFDRIVIYGYLSGLSRPEQVFFRTSCQRPSGACASSMLRASVPTQSRQAYYRLAFPHL